MSVEYNTLGACIDQLVTAVKSDITGIASYLLDKEFISKELHEEITDPNSALSSDAEKATMLVLQVMSTVKLEPNLYYKFVNHLRQKETKYSTVVDLIDAEYFGISESSFKNGEKGRKEL